VGEGEGVFLPLPRVNIADETKGMRRSSIEAHIIGQEVWKRDREGVLRWYGVWQKDREGCGVWQRDLEGECRRG